MKLRLVTKKFILQYTPGRKFKLNNQILNFRKLLLCRSRIQIREVFQVKNHPRYSDRSQLRHKNMRFVKLAKNLQKRSLASNRATCAKVFFVDLKGSNSNKGRSVSANVGQTWTLFSLSLPSLKKNSEKCGSRL